MKNNKRKGCFYAGFADVIDYQSIEREVSDREEVLDLERDTEDIRTLVTRYERIVSEA